MAHDKVDWSKAPEWAQFAAMDKSGAQYWFEEEPFNDDLAEQWACHGRYASFLDCSNWRNSLTQRPQQ